MDEWINAVKIELNIEESPDVNLILDVAREAAHNVRRPAAPITTYLLGYAVAKGANLSDATAKIEALAKAWKPEDLSNS